MDKQLILQLKALIETRVFIKNSEQQIDIYENPNAWLFDFRKVLLNGKTANLISEIFYEEFKVKYPFQFCALEIAGVPLVTSLMNKFYSKGYEDINALFIRKSRKKDGLMKMVEGEVQGEKKIILVDDIINTGNSFWRQVEALDDLGYKVDTAWSILRFRDMDYYKRFHNRGIEIKSLFTLDDFTEVLGENIKNIKPKDTKPPAMLFRAEWVFKSENPSLSYVVEKSQPILDDTKIYFGSDNQTFWALNQKDGSVAWKYKVGPHTKKKSIFSNPALYKNLVIFGSYDGNIYALDRDSGKHIWVCFEADWVGSSPIIAEDLEMIFVGLEFGLFRRHGGIIALDANTGKKMWEDHSHSAFTHASPTYIKEYRQVSIGSNDGRMRLYDAKSGRTIWEFITDGGKSYNSEQDVGFGEGDIKESSVYNKKRDYLIFGAMDGFFYILKRKTGRLVKQYKCEFGIWATPYIYKNRVYFTSLDKRLRCVDLDTLDLIFEKDIDGTRIFSSPTIINDKLYVSTNAGRLHELDPSTGEQLGYFQALERITNSVIYNKDTGIYFLPTYANEIICLRKVIK